MDNVFNKKMVGILTQSMVRATPPPFLGCLCCVPTTLPQQQHPQLISEIYQRIHLLGNLKFKKVRDMMVC